MTVDELHDVLAQRLDGIKEAIDKQNGRLGKVEAEVTGLKIRDAYWAGGIVGVLGLIKLLWR